MSVVAVRRAVGTYVRFSDPPIDDEYQFGNCFSAIARNVVISKGAERPLLGVSKSSQGSYHLNTV